MTDKYKEEFMRALNAILAALPKDASPELHALAHQFYAKLPPIDLTRLNAAEAAEIVTQALEFLKIRTPGAPKIRVLAKSARAVIEILNDDMPFLVDSVTTELTRQGLSLLSVSHPILRLARNEAGELTGVPAPDAPNGPYRFESFIRVETSRMTPEMEEKVTLELERMLESVRMAVADWKPMVAKIEESIEALSAAPADFKAEEVREIKDFLRWLLAKNFIFLGYVEYDFHDGAGKASLSVVPDSELGIFKTLDEELKPKGLEGLPPEVLHFALVPQLIEITKSMRKANVHRPVHMDYIGLKRFDNQGKVIGERRFLGLFTSSVYYQSTDDIPFIRRRIDRMLTRTSYDPASHDGKSLKAIIEFTPRDELFQLSEEDLFDFAMGVLPLELCPDVWLFIRRDAFERFVSCIVFVPRERFSTSLREEVQTILERAFHGKVSSYYTQMTDSPLVRLRLIIATVPGHIPQVDRAALESQIARITYRWSDALHEAFADHYGEDEADGLLRSYVGAFSKAYITDHDASAAVYDIQQIQAVMTSNLPSLQLFRHKSDAPDILHLKWYNPSSQVPLSDVLPVLENMGFKVIDEQPYQVHPSFAALDTVWIRDLTLSADVALLEDMATLKPLLESALERLWQGEMENDKFSGLLLHAQLSGREVDMFRAYARYLRQAAFPYAYDTMAASLRRYPAIARLLMQRFHLRFDPAAQGKSDDAVAAEIESKLGEVANLVDDRILRRFGEVIAATLRTNYYQTESGKPKPYISFKLDSARVPELPLPRPFAEIFVYSVRVEGIHLRGGKVARGGLRWSDRREDFRTEILGLMKAQMVKNAVIVPVGSKGGFVLKRAPAAREALMEEGVACYKIFLSGLLDITDNNVGGSIVPPADVVRYDGDDPYLVVAADKGTATFSDYANAVSQAYGFWLGDAFASGGSVGYDHKKMAITARGGFISVERHFREMGHDIHKEDFTVMGIGDMAGDVFGNGMLLSRHIRLVGAFNHMHIFLDPNPNAEASFQERERLFALPRSNWKDYDANLISKGGGVFERSAKAIALTPEIQKLLGVAKKILSPDELIRAMLLAPVDLLWNGGIGTYVKAEEETHEQVGDRANNAVRVNGHELTCKVVGEGGNLGFTQKGRIEYARNGGRINTDAIDNSAGVDCSDHEVNIKIGLGTLVASNQLSFAKRDQFLSTMTDDVAELVLKDNRLQTQALTIAELQAPQLLDEHIRLMQAFERRGVLDRAVEYLPSDKQLGERRVEQKGLTRPELAVLLAYSKMVLYPELLQSDLPDDPYFQADLKRYFPAAMRKDFVEAIDTHPLRREIVATAVTNSIVNRTGITLIHAITEDTGMQVAEVSRAYVVARDAFGLRTLWAEIEECEGLSVRVQTELFREVTQFVARTTLWFLRSAPQPLDITRIMEDFNSGIASYLASYEAMISEAIQENYRARITNYVENAVPEALAVKVARLAILSSACDVVGVSNGSGRALIDVGTLYFTLGALLQLDWLRDQAQHFAAQSHWDRLAVHSLVSSLYDEQRRLTASVLAKGGLDAWKETARADVERFTGFMDDLRTVSELTLPKLVIAVKKLGEVGRA